MPEINVLSKSLPIFIKFLPLNTMVRIDITEKAPNTIENIVIAKTSSKVYLSLFFLNSLNFFFFFLYVFLVLLIFFIFSPNYDFITNL